MSVNQTISIQRELRRKINKIPKQFRLEFFSRFQDLIEEYQPNNKVDS